MSQLTIASSISVAVLTLTTVAAVPTPGNASGEVHDEGTLLNGAAYSLHRPAEWNGDLVVLPGRPDLDSGVVDWLVEENYGVIGYDLSDDWNLLTDKENATTAWRTFAGSVGAEPNRTIVAGRSQAGLVTRMVAEESPPWLDAALPMCGGGAGNISTWNYKLDTAFVLKELVDSNSTMQIVGIKDRDSELAAMNELVSLASSTPQGRARAAFAAALSKIPAVNPDTGLPLSDPDARIDRYLEHLPFAMGSHVRVGYEQTVGGVFSWNTGIDYSRELHSSGRWAEVVAAYRAAGLNLDADLDILARAERISADPDVVGVVERSSTFSGRLATPVLSLHTTGDGAGSIQDDEAYAMTVREAGDTAQLRQLTVASDGHCTFTAAEEAVAVDTLFTRLSTGHWPSVSPTRLIVRAQDLQDESVVELGDARFVHRPHTGALARPWTAQDWGTYAG